MRDNINRAASDYDSESIFLDSSFINRYLPSTTKCNSEKILEKKKALEDEVNKIKITNRLIECTRIYKPPIEAKVLFKGMGHFTKIISMNRHGIFLCSLLLTGKSWKSHYWLPPTDMFGDKSKMAHFSPMAREIAILHRSGLIEIDDQTVSISKKGIIIAIMAIEFDISEWLEDKNILIDMMRNPESIKLPMSK